MTRRDKRARAKALARSFCLSATALGLLSAFSLVSVPFARAADDDLAGTCAGWAMTTRCVTINLR